MFLFVQVSTYRSPLFYSVVLLSITKIQLTCYNGLVRRCFKDLLQGVPSFLPPLKKTESQAQQAFCPLLSVYVRFYPFFFLHVQPFPIFSGPFQPFPVIFSHSRYFQTCQVISSQSRNCQSFPLIVSHFQTFLAMYSHLKQSVAIPANYINLQRFIAMF